MGGESVAFSPFCEFRILINVLDSFVCWNTLKKKKKTPADRQKNM